MPERMTLSRLVEASRSSQSRRVSVAPICSATSGGVVCWVIGVSTFFAGIWDATPKAGVSNRKIMIPDRRDKPP